MSTRQRSDAPRVEIREAWDSIATGFDEFATPITIRFGEEVVSRTKLQPGTRFLDVAAGTGALAIPAARRGARVTATDIAPTMIERLKARAEEEGLPDLEGRVMDGHSLQLDDDTFDVSASLNGVSLFPDFKRGLAELVRVTKPGGKVIIATFGAPTKVEFIGFFVRALQVAVPGAPGLPMDPPPLPFQVSDPEVLRQEMEQANLTDVQIETTTWPMEFRSGSHSWDMFTSSNPIGASLVAELTPEQETEVKQVLDGMLRERSGGGPGAVLNSEVNIGIGTK